MSNTFQEVDLAIKSQCIRHKILRPDQCMTCRYADAFNRYREEIKQEKERAEQWKTEAAKSLALRKVAEKSLAAAKLALKPLAELKLRTECERGDQPGMFFIDDDEIKAARAVLSGRTTSEKKPQGYSKELSDALWGQDPET